MFAFLVRSFNATSDSARAVADGWALHVQHAGVTYKGRKFNKVELIVLPNLEDYDVQKYFTNLFTMQMYSFL